MSDYVRLGEAPQWCIQYPTCSACSVDLETDGDGWTCPGCGTSWSMDATDGDEGTLYEDWSGERLAGPTMTHDEAETVALQRQAERRRKLLDGLLGRGRTS